MIIAYDHTPEAVDLIWHDDEEYFEMITPTQNDNLVGSANTSPMKNMFVPYELIQYIEGHYDRVSAINKVNELKSTVDETQYQRMLGIIGQANEGYNIKYVPSEK